MAMRLEVIGIHFLVAWSLEACWSHVQHTGTLVPCEQVFPRFELLVFSSTITAILSLLKVLVEIKPHDRGDPASTQLANSSLFQEHVCTAS